ncbi:MAG: sigma-54 dependent transcriptional regulator [Treponema sp.]|nr:sigma-54 dependent transcriptional regulator [Treponema sp.]MCL2252339.1 sigma-54 dependent transcriptional regulator [Treponema sp.]
MLFRLLVIDDEKNLREGLAEYLHDTGYEVVCAENGEEGWKLFNNGDIDLVITDLKMPGISGVELMKRILAHSPGFPVIILTGHGTIDIAVAAMHQGAWDFLSKPVDLDHLSLKVKRALENRELYFKHRQMEEELERKRQFKSIIGNSRNIREIFDMINKVASTKASILITGESGVGKELVANAIHELSARKDQPFVKVHCAALSSTLLESELFGHEKGSFTGALSQRRGRFELASGGTLFLDEIGEIDQNLQIKLLRVLQEKKFERVGGEKTIEVDVRIIAATNKDLKAEIEKGNFREDLYFRLNVVNILVPPLRERKDDIPLLITSFIKEFAQENGKSIDSIHEKARSRLYAYDWPGNIRELRNCMESAVVMCQSNMITVDDLPPAFRSTSDDGWVSIKLGSSMSECEKIIIRETLSHCQGNKSKTADMLEIGRKTLLRKLAEYDLGSQEEDDVSP